MKKLFSILIFCFVLCLSSCFAFQTAQNAINSCINNCSDTINSNYNNYFDYAYSYFYNNYSAVIENYNYVYMYPCSPRDSNNSNGDFIRFILWASNSEPALISGDALTNQSFGSFYFKTNTPIYAVALDLHFTTFGSINSTNVYTSNVTARQLSSMNSTTTSYQWCNYDSTTQSYYNFVGSSLSLNGLGTYLRSKTGNIKYYVDSTYTSTNTLLNVQGFTAPITSSDYYDISISRDNLTQVSDGTHNYYAFTNIDFNFSNYFSTNISSNSDLYYTLIIDSLEYSFIPVTKATDGYNNNRVRLDISSANHDLLSACNNGLTLVLWYQESGSSTRLGQTSYKFYINANNTSTGTSSSGQDNQYTITGRDNNIPVVINNVISYDDNLNNAGLNNGSPYNVDYSDADMRNRFSNMFEFFSIAFSWLPSEIIGLVKIGFWLAVTFLVLKIIRG